MEKGANFMGLWVHNGQIKTRRRKNLNLTSEKLAKWEHGFWLGFVFFF